MLIAQSLGPLEVTTTLAFAGAVTVLLDFPSADFTVTVMPSPEPEVVADTLPPPAVTLVDIDPALDEPCTPDPVVDVLLFILHPPIDPLDVLTEELVSA